MCHALLVLALDETESVNLLQERLPDPGYIAMAQNAQSPAEEGGYLPIPFHFLDLQKANDGLSNSQPDCIISLARPYHFLAPFLLAAVTLSNWGNANPALSAMD